MNRPSSHFREGVTWELPSSAVGTVQLQWRGRLLCRTQLLGSQLEGGHIKDMDAQGSGISV